MTCIAKRVAVIGGGVSGTCAANQLISSCTDLSTIEVVLFDQGGRGPGGRASHRRVQKSDSSVLPDDIPITSDEASGTYQFDHGCQFFCASDGMFLEKIAEWCDADVVKLWNKRCAFISNDIAFENCCHDYDRCDTALTNKIRGKDFFGILSGNDCYAGVGGMQKIARYEANTAVSKGAVLRSGVRVSKIIPAVVQDLESISSSKANVIDPDRVTAQTDTETGDSKRDGRQKWELFGIGGTAALHDTAETIAAGATHHSLGLFDAVIVTDASCSFDDWHRASAGISAIKPEFGEFIKSRARIPLFTVMVAFDSTVCQDFDAIVFDIDEDNENKNDDDGRKIICDGDVSTDQVHSPDGLWFAARSSSKPGFISCERTDVWTLVSTPSFAVTEISSTTMQDEKTISGRNGGNEIKVNVFKPQENKYLNEGPAVTLLNSFLSAIEKAKIKKKSRHENTIKNMNSNSNITIDGDKAVSNSNVDRIEIIYIGDNSGQQEEVEKEVEVGRIKSVAENTNYEGKEVEEEKVRDMEFKCNGSGNERGGASGICPPKVLYLQGQRWGSALPGDFLPKNIDLDSSSKYHNVEGVIYQSTIPDLNVKMTKEKYSADSPTDFETKSDSPVDNAYEKIKTKNYLYDDELGLYYCGDFCSQGVAGIQAASLSGLQVASHLINTLSR